MRYERLLLTSWTRREWLSVLVIGVTSAFLVGAVFLLVTVGSYTTTLEDDLGGSAVVETHGSVEEAEAAATEGNVVVPYALVVDGEGRRHRIIGVPPDAPAVIRSASVAWKQAGIPRPGANVTGPVVVPERRTLDGDSGEVRTVVRPHPEVDSLFPSWWYVANASTVDRLGTDGAFRIDPQAADGGIDTAVPLLGALPFLVGGIGELVRTLSVGVLAGGLIVVVIVFSVSRMAIRDRLGTIRVVRATGGSPHRLFAVLVGRGALVTLAGVLVGTALGIGTTLAAVRVATALGVPVTLSPTFSPNVLRTLVPLLGVLFLSGVLAAAGAALPSVRDAPGQIGSSTTARPRSAWHIADRVPIGTRFQLRDRLEPSILGRRAAIPTATSLTVFVLVVLLLGAFVGSFAPLTSTDGGTVIESDAPHPLNSRISTEYASLLREQGVEASPEVLYAQVHDGQPYLARGANYTSFSGVTDVELVAGRQPRTPDEAVVGSSLARTLDLSVGDRITLGGSVSPGVRRVTVVGRFRGPHVFDDQLVLPLETIEGLSSAPGTVHLIRTEGLDDSTWGNLTSRGPAVLTTAVSAPERLVVGQQFNASVTVRNLNGTPETTTVSLDVDGTVHERTVTLAADEERTVDFTLAVDSPGRVNLAAGSRTASVTVAKPDTFVVPPETPATAPPGAALSLPAVTAEGSLVAGATVTVGEFSAPTDERGVATVPLPDNPGTYEVVISKPGYTTARSEIKVSPDTERHITGRMTVTPRTGGVFTRPELELVLANPWGRPLERNLTLVTPAGTETREARLNPGNVTRLKLSADELGFPDRLQPGEYPIRLLADGREVATTTYRVEGDAESLSAISGSGSYARGTGISQAIVSVFGNVQVLFATLFVLAGLASVGATTATFARAVQTRERTVGVYRATGSSRGRVLGILLVDALKLALPSALVGVVAGTAVMYAFEAAGLLVAFGVRLQIPLEPWVLVGTVVAAVGLAVVSALGAGAAFLWSRPTALLRAE